MVRAVVAMVAAMTMLAACEPGTLVPDAGGGSTGTGEGGTGGTVCLTCAGGQLSDFEDLAAATVLMEGGRNGYWYTYNDGSATCAQEPAVGATYVGAAPPTLAPGTIGSLALHAMWTGCDTWGAGIGADINTPVTAGGIYSGPKVAYDLTPYTGITFWAMATPGTDTQLRVKLPMRAETRVEDGGLCIQSSTSNCSDDWGEKFSLPTNGNWKQITVRFSDPGFLQQGWGAAYAWDPTDVTSIQIQASDSAQTYDFWIDDVYLLP